MVGKLIVIEGTDGTGKETQTKILIEKMKSSDIPVETMSFPRYELEWGMRVRQYLSGMHKDGIGNDPWPPSTLYAMDRLSATPQLLEWLDNGTNVVLDRYMESNLGYQGAKLEGNERSELIKKLTYFEHNMLGIPRSDLVIYLDLPLQESVKVIKKREEEAKAAGKSYKDIHEQDMWYLGKVRETYLELAFTRKNWKTIDCMKKDGNRLPREDISFMIWQHVSELVNAKFI